MASGIYKIENTETGKVYFGQARDIDKRWRQHVNKLNRGYHHNHNLQHAWDKDGAKCFKFSVLEYCEVEQLTEREQHYLDTHMPAGNCYNATGIARTPSNGYSAALFEGGADKFSDDELLALLNEHKTVAKVAEIVGMTAGGLFSYLQRHSFEKVVTHRWVAQTN